ncbi:unnamed protein product (macronuclear) [Paramecium tetraurelia]|uniref:Uncharacterized protein n=1 Tax=Paramecium tetraurelia TaxID=5888 RepID=A0C495_PARTE|nr:uncharacterized protein GSPATT00035092001 [Paramecium tetraurelia]CAK65612.1 unnamed protein product [Paramecium tetraurelia]|eukprot:XP_001433009.1 hypothetical protein (macronuclear) [Paramecium tetraurelia strain d4-2]
MNKSLNTSRDTRSSLQEVVTTHTEQIIKSNQLEQELHRVNQQRKLLSMELDDWSYQYVQKSQALQECELENALLKRQIHTQSQSEDIQKLHVLLQQIFIKSRQKNQIILEWTKKFENIEKRLENENKLQQQVKQQQYLNDIIKQQLTELKQQQIILSKNYLELKEERNQYYLKFIEASSQIQKLEINNTQLEIERTKFQSDLKLVKQDCLQLTERLNQVQSVDEKKNKWKTRYHDLLKQFKDNSIEQPNQQLIEQPNDEIQNHQQEFNIVENYDNEELNDMKDKLQQLEQENQYLREQNIDLRNQFQSATDKLLKQQLQNSMTKEQSQTFSFVHYHREYCDSLEEQQIQD